MGQRSGILLAPKDRQLSNNVRKYQDKIEGSGREARPILDTTGSLPGFPRKPRKNHIRKQGMLVKEAIPVLTYLQSVTPKICSHSVVSNIRPRGEEVLRGFSSLSSRMRCSVRLWERVRTAIFPALVSFYAFSPQGHTRKLSLASRIWLSSQTTRKW